MLAALDRLVDPATETVDTQALQQLKDAAATSPATTDLHRALSEGLRLCAQAVLDQDVPIRIR